MDKVLIGKVVSFHGVKGEIRILSHFPYKKKAFMIDSFIWIQDQCYKIRSYRVHKQYDMITLEGYIDLNSVLELKGKKVYKKKEDLALDDKEYLDEDLLSLEVFSNDRKIGRVIEVFLASKDNKIIRIETLKKEILLPLQSPFIEKIDFTNGKIFVQLLEGME